MNSTSEQTTPPQNNHFLVVIDPERDEQPALHQAILWAQALEDQPTTITALLCIYDYAAEINMMMTGTILHNFRRDLMQHSEAWLDNVIQKNLPFKPDELTNITVTPKLTWAKKSFQAVETELKSSQQIAQTHPYSMLFKAVLPHPTHHFLTMRNDEWQLVRCSNVPVMLVREVQSLLNVDWLVGVDPHNPLHLELNNQVINYTSRCQQTFGGNLSFAHANPPIAESLMPIFSIYGGGEYIIGLDPAADEEKIAAFIKQHHLTREQLHSTAGEVDAVLRNRVTELTNPLIIIGSRATTGFADRLVGHSAEKIIEHCDNNVLIIKKRERI